MFNSLTTWRQHRQEDIEENWIDKLSEYAYLSYINLNFFQRAVNFKKNCNVILDTLMCPLQMTSDLELISLTPHVINGHFTHQPPISKITQLVITQRPVKKKKVHLSYICLHVCANLWLKIQNANHYRNSETFSISVQSALYTCPPKTKLKMG